MSDKELQVNKLSVTIQRGKHDKEHPYVMISKKMLRDPGLSAKSKGVLCYLLSLPDTWQAHPKQVAKSMGMGKDQIYSSLKELIKTGYATKKEIRKEKGRFGSILYEFYEDKLPEELRFKENITVSGNPDTVGSNDDSPYPGFPDAENPPLKNKDSRDNRIPKTPPIPPQKESAKAVVAKATEIKNPKPTKTKSQNNFSPQVEELTEKMIESLKGVNPDWIEKPTTASAMSAQAELMIEKDKRDPRRILAVFMWTIFDSFWMDKISKPNPAKYLRDNFAQLAAKMDAKPPEKNEIDRRLRDKNGKVSDEWKDHLF